MHHWQNLTYIKISWSTVCVSLQPLWSVIMQEIKLNFDSFVFVTQQSSSFHIADSLAPH